MDDKSRNSKKHSGIGLYMADLVIKQHNGELVLGNSGRTGGAEVVVKIPYYKIIFYIGFKINCTAFWCIF